jgi:hypothetical protein
MMPRSIGAVSTRLTAGSFSTRSRKPGSWSGWMSTTKIGGRHLGQVAGDRGAQVRVDLAHGGQHRQPEPERQHHRRRLAPARPPRRASASAGAAEARTPARAGGKPAHAKRAEHQRAAKRRGCRPPTRASGRAARTASAASPPARPGISVRPRRRGAAGPACARRVAVERRGPHLLGARQRPEREDKRRQKRRRAPPRPAARDRSRRPPAPAAAPRSAARRAAASAAPRTSPEPRPDQRQHPICRRVDGEDRPSRRPAS